jgi:hypothetical protein
VTNGSSVTAVSNTVYSLQPRERDAVRDGQHRNADLGVFIFTRDGQRPEMRRRPDEHDQEQQQRVGIDAVGHGDPAEHRRRRTGRTTDHDVLRRRALEPHGVDDGVTDQRGEREHGGQHVDQPHEDRHRQQR